MSYIISLIAWIERGLEFIIFAITTLFAVIAKMFGTENVFDGSFLFCVML